MSQASSSRDPVNRVVIYRPKPGQLAELEAIVTRHGAVLRKVGLITDDPVRVFRAREPRKPEAGTFLVEHFRWRDGAASDIAHQTPDVMAVWETMGAHLQDMTLTTLEPLDDAAQPRLARALVLYRPKAGSEAALLALCKQHAPALRASGLVDPAEPVQLYRATDLVRHGAPAPYLVETFAWKSPGAAEAAHQSPEIMAVWEPMTPHLAELTIMMLEPIA